MSTPMVWPAVASLIWSRFLSPVDGQASGGPAGCLSRRDPKVSLVQS
jgi:hypothetical protein